jgi:16S rRNA (cytidine1402-2'-O)-methyltransferase
MTPTLYLVPTPIGNLADMTYRSVAVLQEVALILAEDTRTSGKLLKHYGINTPMRSFHMHNEHQQVAHWTQELPELGTLALISDAGTPGLSDPGYLLAHHCLAAGHQVITLPGANAALPALMNSGLPNHRFAFEGFLPPKKGRKTRLQALAEEPRTMIFYESPHRLPRTLRDLAQYLGPERAASYSREISKKFEESQSGTLASLREHFEKTPPRGEFVLCVAGL